MSTVFVHVGADITALDLRVIVCNCKDTYIHRYIHRYIHIL